MPADKFYIVLSGTVHASIDGELVAPKHAGDAFGEMALISDERRTADVLAMEPCELAVLHRHDYLEVVSAKQQAKMGQKLHLIENNPLLTCLTASQRDAFARCGKLRRPSAGETHPAHERLLSHPPQVRQAAALLGRRVHHSAGPALR